MTLDIAMTVHREYVVPSKQVISPSDLHAFLHSNTYSLINDFVEELSKSVEDTPITPDIETSHVRRLQMSADKTECQRPLRNIG